MLVVYLALMLFPFPREKKKNTRAVALQELWMGRKNNLGIWRREGHENWVVDFFAELNEGERNLPLVPMHNQCVTKKLCAQNPRFGRKCWGLFFCCFKKKSCAYIHWSNCYANERIRKWMRQTYARARIVYAQIGNCLTATKLEKIWNWTLKSKRY